MDLELKIKTYSIDDETVEILRTYARIKKTSMSAIIRQLINDHCRPHGTTPKIGG